MGIDKIVIKNNKLRMKNKVISNKAKGGAWGSIVGLLLVAVGGYFGVPIPEEVAGEVAGGVVALVGFLGSWFASPDDPETIEAVE